MKQILQNLKTGKTELVEVPVPGAKSGHILILTKVSLISAGTERMLVDLGKGNLIENKQRGQPLPGRCPKPFLKRGPGQESDFMPRKLVGSKQKP